MANWTLAGIRQKVRQVTGRFSNQEMTNNQLDEYINRYFQYTFPAELKLERFHTYYEFVTQPNVQSYTLPSGYVNFEPPATIDRQLLLWYQDPASFWDQSWYNVSSQVIGVGNGAQTVFNGTAQTFPIMPATTIITDNVERFVDTNTVFANSPVTITGSLGGTATVNYRTGAVAVTFATFPANGQNVLFSYVQFQPGLPQAVLLYNNAFTFYPIPDTSYRFAVAAYANSLVTTAAGVTATQFTDASDTPLLDEWGPCIAYGTSRDIHADKGEMDAYAEITALYKEQLAYVLKRTNQNLLNTRSAPSF